MIQEVKPFQFKQFSVEQDQCAMKVGTDGVLLGAWANIDGVENILDIGTGTGVIAIMLAQRCQNAMVHAIEIDQKAFDQAQRNMETSPFSSRLKGIHMLIQDYAKTTHETYDLIVSNPPFFSGGTFSSNENRRNVRHTTKLPNGELLSAARRLLKKTGRFCVILPFIEGLRFQELAVRYNLYCTKCTEVLPKADRAVERLLLQFEKQSKTTILDQLIIQNGGRHNYSKAYTNLTKDFYLKM